jgi:hypothetical protein
VLVPTSGPRGWHTQRGGGNREEVVKSVLRRPQSGESLVADRTFTVFAAESLAAGCGWAAGAQRWAA